MLRSQLAEGWTDEVAHLVALNEFLGAENERLREYVTLARDIAAKGQRSGNTYPDVVMIEELLSSALAGVKIEKGRRET